MKEKFSEADLKEARTIVSQVRRTGTPGNPNLIRFRVDGNAVWLQFKRGDLVGSGCTCAGKACKHIAASYLYLLQSGEMRSITQKEEYSAGESLLSWFDTPLKETRASLSVTVLHQPGTFSLGLKIGAGKDYVIRNIPAFIKQIEERVPVTFGKGFTFEPEWMDFSKPDTALLEFCAEVVSGRLFDASDARRVPLAGRQISRLFRLLMGRSITYIRGTREFEGVAVKTGTVSPRVSLEQRENDVVLTAEFPFQPRTITPDCEFVWTGAEITRLSKTEREILKPLIAGSTRGKAVFRFAEKDSERLVCEVLPQLSRVCPVDISEPLAGRISVRQLISRVYLEKAGGDITAHVLFCYGDTQIDPFSPRAPGGLLLMRDAEKEHAVLEVLSSFGFRVQKGQVYLAGSDEIFKFIVEGMPLMAGLAELYYDEAFRHMSPRKVHIAGHVRMLDGLISFELLEELGDDDLRSLLDALKAKKRYLRLSDGAFLEISQGDGVFELGDYLSQAGRVRDGRIELEARHAAYLGLLFEDKPLDITLDETFARCARAYAEPGDPCPETLAGVLRPYQDVGCMWIQALYRMNLGGVLADDMGLGKTLQVIAAILWAKEKFGPELSVVIAPTSLTYNWQAEIDRFSPELNVVVLEGAAAHREETIKRLAEIAEASAATTGEENDSDDSGIFEDSAYSDSAPIIEDNLNEESDAIPSHPDKADILIMSYAQLRRDAHLLTGIKFRFCVLDEAQHIKNAASVGAKAARKIEAGCRLALTGTPMENHAGELWSVFEYSLPGYLGNYPQFMKRHGEGQGANELRRKIRPFLMRRLKRDVLSELPEKIEHHIPVELLPEQKRVYQSALLHLKSEMDKVKGDRMKVLAAITRLRQICCHPSLYLEGYEGGSGKLDLLLELTSDALASGHRLLVFSQFTSMLKLIRTAYNAAGISSLYLDGQTPAQSRSAIVNEFNDGYAGVFLISLKAGGTGLNLTGADTVVLYDPWWNPAAEDQAADRAHRMGQKRAVQVMRLITRGTIEEQVWELCRLKRELFDAFIEAGEAPSSLSTEAILELIYN